MLRGEIWWGVYPNDRSGKTRPLLIVSNDAINKSNGQDIVVVKVTSLMKSDGSQRYVNQYYDVIVQLKNPSVIQTAAIYTTLKKNLRSLLSTITSVELSQVDRGLKNSLDL
ncbi:type II toxin-antitoxin system PemK/MazF family toxin [Halobacteriovorax sp. JY17]|uniref:type II toxin-antitoxin system PemK/MazF family toxin n=1 Tax=Halobacteriovorax sp. JY17 TaxID=2014617 RepID=UPI000C664024|nr:type II toxin-antitoxin system PemK/MazF family toxin [Halobacteriovorax sp. JY17]PIK16728.1 MAG: hypothetical protein CES88_08270 [Halobacteriovorax sp. JY17]